MIEVVTTGTPWLGDQTCLAADRAGALAVEPRQDTGRVPAIAAARARR